MNTIVNFETAKLLKDKKYNELCFYRYDLAGRLEEPYEENGSSTDVEFKVSLTDLLQNHNYRASSSSPYMSAPTHSEVVMWLYKTHKIFITVSFEGFDSLTKEPLFRGDVRNINTPSGGFYYVIRDKDNGLYFTSPDSTYKAAILYTLTNLI